ncbi:MAG TPA: transaldolase family protein [Burkholderiales bacterium]|nr:transaldolase family protein [Burkholderiales bacterium]
MIEPRFHLYIDTADPAAVRANLPHPLIYGVTTNPTLMRRASLKRSALPGFVEQALALGARAVQVQVESPDTAGMLRDARAALAWGPSGRIIPKIPATRAGFAAGSELSAGGVRVTYTAVFTPEQAMFAANAGAAYAAPYFGRLQDQGVDGAASIARMQALIDRYGSGTRLLVASVRSRDAFLSLLDLGVGAITVPPTLLPELLEHQATLEAQRDFLSDAESVR